MEEVNLIGRRDRFELFIRSCMLLISGVLEGDVFGMGNGGSDLVEADDDPLVLLGGHLGLFLFLLNHL